MKTDDNGSIYQTTYELVRDPDTNEWDDGTVKVHVKLSFPNSDAIDIEMDRFIDVKNLNALTLLKQLRIAYANGKDEAKYDG